MGIAKAKEIINHQLGQVGVLINLDTTSTLSLSSTKFDFDTPPAGWVFYGLTAQETKLTTDVNVFESVVGIPEFTLKRFLTGVQGTITGTFREVDAEIHDLISGDHVLKNIGGVAAAGANPVIITAVDGTAHTVGLADADATNLFVGNTVTIETDPADLAGSLNTARITAKASDAGTTTLTFAESWFRTTPIVGDSLQSYTYVIGQLAASELEYVQILLVYESTEGNQFLYYFPKCTFTPNTSPEFPTTSSVFSLPFEAKIIGEYNTLFGFDGAKKVLGYFFELLHRETS